MRVSVYFLVFIGMKNHGSILQSFVDCLCHRGLKGVTVALSEDGRLSCSYLGTDPSMISHPSSYLREIDYSSVDAEMRHLQRIIKEHQSKSGKRLCS